MVWEGVWASVSIILKPRLIFIRDTLASSTYSSKIRQKCAWKEVENISFCLTDYCCPLEFLLGTNYVSTFSLLGVLNRYNLFALVASLEKLFFFPWVRCLAQGHIIAMFIYMRILFSVYLTQCQNFLLICVRSL